MPGMYLAGDMIVLGAGKYLFVWDPILCWIGSMLVTNVVVGQASCYVREGAKSGDPICSARFI